jgi:hypothetical protein
MSIFSECEEGEITNEGVRIRFLGFPKTIPFCDIKSIQKVSYWRAVLESMNLFKPAMWGLWKMSLFGVVLIETIDGRRWPISPRNRDEFVKLVSNHLTISN